MKIIRTTSSTSISGVTFYGRLALSAQYFETCPFPPSVVIVNYLIAEVLSRSS